MLGYVRIYCLSTKSRTMVGNACSSEKARLKGFYSSAARMPLFSVFEKRRSEATAGLPLGATLSNWLDCKKPGNTVTAVDSFIDGRDVLDVWDVEQENAF